MSVLPPSTMTDSVCGIPHLSLIHISQKEANTIVKSAEDKLISMINEHEITQQAQEKAEEIIENAKNTAKEIRVGVRQYSNCLLYTSRCV